MLNNENMYKKLYCLDFKNNAVVTVRIIATEISDNGYIMHTVLTKDGIMSSVDDAIVFYTLPEAEEALANWKPVNDEIIKIMNDSNKVIDKLRVSINGNPHFPEYAAALKKEQRKG